MSCYIRSYGGKILQGKRRFYIYMTNKNTETDIKKWALLKAAGLLFIF